MNSKTPSSSAARITSVPAALALLLVVYIAVVARNAGLIYVGHMVLYFLPSPRPLSPFMELYTTPTFSITRGLGALGSLIVVFPIFSGLLGCTIYNNAKADIE